jgi:mannan endo-1,6-alpha-mannosidase
MKFRHALAGASAVATVVAQGIDLNPNDPNSFISAAKTACKGMMTYYHGNEPGQIPGLLPQPYYWWEAGGMMGQLMAYSNLTGDTQYDNLVKQAMQFQVGENQNFMPQNQTNDMGNDDQVFWAFSAMDAAELDFSNPGSDEPSWLALAQAVFNSQVPRWDNNTCGGGLRWQVFPFNAGYNYKNAISTGGLFQLSARLARYTGNQTYADWADTTWDWLWNSAIMGQKWYVWDGIPVEDCSQARDLFWTYNVGTMIMGSAYMYDFTNQSSQWQDRLQNLLHTGASVFFVQSAGANSPAKPAPAGGQILAEVACEFSAAQTCNYDEPSFKAYVSRWLHVTMQLAPFTQTFIQPLLKASAVAAATQCAGTGQPGPNTCGRRWYQTSWDGMSGVGEQMSAMSIFLSNLQGQKPLSAHTGGTSKSDPNAGNGASDDSALENPVYTRAITTGDKFGASILTIISLGMCLGGSWFMLF